MLTIKNKEIENGITNQYCSYYIDASSPRNMQWAAVNTALGDIILPPQMKPFPVPESSLPFRRMDTC